MTDRKQDLLKNSVIFLAILEPAILSQKMVENVNLLIKRLHCADLMETANVKNVCMHTRGSQPPLGRKPHPRLATHNNIF